MSPDFKELNHEPSENEYKLTGRVLYITKDPQLIRLQIDGTNLNNISSNELLANISTDVIIPTSECLKFTGKQAGLLGDYLLTGFSDDLVNPGDIKRGGFGVIIAGDSFGRGSSRYHAQIALKEAGIQIIAAGTERIFRENCVNAGIFTTNVSEELVKHVQEGTVPFEMLFEGLHPVYQDMMREGGLLAFLRGIEGGRISYKAEQGSQRAMTATEKILALAARNETGGFGLSCVQPGQVHIVKPHQYFGYELQTPITRAALEQEYGQEIPTKAPWKLTLFDDHTALLPENHPTASLMRKEQKRFIIPLIPHGATLFEAHGNQGTEGICHTVMLEQKALPGQLILGNDSHTCTLGAVNALAIGKGAVDLAGAIAHDQMIVEVPGTIRFNLHGQLPEHITTKDLMLQLLARRELKEEHAGSGKVFEFGGEGLSKISFDEQIKLTNMAIEGQGYSGILEPNEEMIKYLLDHHPELSRQEIEKMLVYSDKNAIYDKVYEIDLSQVKPTIALPGDTQNGVPLSEVVSQNVKISKAYIGSCTHGTPTDLRQAAEVLRGRKVKDGVRLYIQASSLANLAQSRKEGSIQDLVEAGAILLPPGCGACMNAGPGATENEDEIGIFATNRNFPGRTGKGKAYLASPAVVAASSIKGEICGPQDIIF